MTSLLTHWKLILGLVLSGLLIVLWLLWRGQVAEVGRLESINTELSRQVRETQEANDKLTATIDLNAAIAKDDALKQQAIQQKVLELNKAIDQLKLSKKLLKPKQQKSCPSPDGDEELSDELKELLDRAYKGK